MSDATTEDTKPTDVPGTALTEWVELQAGINALQHRLGNVAYDLKSVKGNQTARRDRKELVRLRTAVEARRLDLNKKDRATIELRITARNTFADELKAIVVALEKPIDDQITADETRREEERKVAEAAEAARKAKLQAKVDEIRNYALDAAERTAAEILQTGRNLKAYKIDAETFAEFAETANAVRDQVIGQLAQAHARAVIAEEQAKRLAAAEAENERMRKADAERKERQEAEAKAERERQAEANRAAQAQIDAQRAELERQRQDQDAKNARLRNGMRLMALFQEQVVHAQQVKSLYAIDLVHRDLQARELLDVDESQTADLETARNKALEAVVATRAALVVELDRQAADAKAEAERARVAREAEAARQREAAQQREREAQLREKAQRDEDERLAAERARIEKQQANADRLTKTAPRLLKAAQAALAPLGLYLQHLAKSDPPKVKPLTSVVKELERAIAAAAPVD